MERNSANTVEGRKEGMSTDSDKRYLRRDSTPPGDADQFLPYIPWKCKDMKVDIDPRKFYFAIICCRCNNYQNTLHGMQTHLKKCPHKYAQKLMCGHCEQVVDKWRLMVDHLNAKGRQSDLPCKPQYRMRYIKKPVFPKVAVAHHTRSLTTLGRRVKTTAVAGQTACEYNSWCTADPDTLASLNKEAKVLKQSKSRQRVEVDSSIPPVQLSSDNQDLLSMALQTAGLPAAPVSNLSTYLSEIEQVESVPDIDTRSLTMGTSVELSPATAAVSLGLLNTVAMPEIVPFISSPLQPPLSPILSLDPGCDVEPDDIAEETLAVEELQRVIPGLGHEGEISLPNVVQTHRIAIPVAVARDPSFLPHSCESSPLLPILENARSSPGLSLLSMPVLTVPVQGCTSCHQTESEE